MKICVVGAGTTSIFDNMAHSSKQILDIVFAPSKAIGKVLTSELPHTGNKKCMVLYLTSAKASSEIEEVLSSRGFEVMRLYLHENEVTLDLDVVARMDLLDFIKAECE
ncbi:hypothetical protein AgCh_024024 [Apium graveolens]